MWKLHNGVTNENGDNVVWHWDLKKERNKTDNPIFWKWKKLWFLVWKWEIKKWVGMGNRDTNREGLFHGDRSVCSHCAWTRASERERERFSRKRMLKLRGGNLLRCVCEIWCSEAKERGRKKREESDGWTEQKKLGGYNGKFISNPVCL